LTLAPPVFARPVVVIEDASYITTVIGGYKEIAEPLGQIEYH
jgi:hypothetical protein